MRQATLGGVGICQCRARKVQPIELWGISCWLLPSALGLTGPMLFALGFAYKLLQGLDWFHRGTAGNRHFGSGQEISRRGISLPLHLRT